MIARLTERAVPRLRELGFHGTFPHFRRATETANHILAFQFDKNGGGFVVEIAKTPPGDLVLPDGEGSLWIKLHLATWQWIDESGLAFHQARMIDGLDTTEVYFIVA